AIEKSAIHRAIRTVILAWSIRIEQPYDDCLSPILQRRVSDLHFVDPLRHRIVIQLFDFILVHYSLDHQIGPVAVNLGRRKVYETKLQPLLKPDYVLGADSVCTPQRFVEVFTIPAAKFRGTVVDVIKWTTPFEYAFELAKFPDITTRVQWHFN